MLDTSKLKPTEKFVLKDALNLYCNAQVRLLVEDGEWSAVQALRVREAEHLIDVIEETLV